MSLANIIQLRQLLADKFPGLRTRADDLVSRSRASWETGLSQIDEPLGGGFPKAALTEIICPHRSCGGASLMGHLLRHAAATRQFAALIDAQDSFDPATFSSATLSRLLWLRCESVDQSLKAADLLVRDGNLPLLMADLALSPDAQLRKVPAPTWYRFQRIAEERGVTFVVFTPWPMISPAQARVTLRTRLDLAALERDSADVLADLEVDVADTAHGHAIGESMRRSA